MEREPSTQRWSMDEEDVSGDVRTAVPYGRSLLSSSMVGSANRGRVLQTLFDLGPTSRAELARLAGVNRTTISGIVQPLLDQQVLVEGNPIRPSEAGGKPARPLWFSPDARPICGMMLMPDAVHTCLVTLAGTISAEHSVRFPVENPKIADIKS
ncbi:MAG TPA: sugar kinase, partial [Kaistia sp.]|nr:sugar kinase [Kaistia sp.]